MSKAQNTNDSFRKYVLLDTPFFSRGTEGAKFIFKRHENQSVAATLKIFFLKPLMRIEAKKQIAQMINSENFQKIDETKNLLTKINALPFWQGVDPEEVRKALIAAAHEKVYTILEPNETAFISDTLHHSLYKEISIPQHIYMRLREDPILEYLNENDSDESEEEFSSEQSENEIKPDELENKAFPKQVEKEINEMSLEEKIISDNFKKESKENELRKKIEQENLREETERIRIIKSIRQAELAEIVKQADIERKNEIDNLKKDINPDSLKEDINLQLEKKYPSNEDRNQNIYAGLDELISHLNTPNKVCSAVRNPKINIFMKAFQSLECDTGFPFTLSNQITNVYAWYTEKYTEADKKGNLEEINKIMHPESETPVAEEKQRKLAEEMRNKLIKIPDFNDSPDALNAFVEYCENPRKIDLSKRDDYEEFLRIFYININKLNRIDRSQCLNIADSLEGLLKSSYGTDLDSFNYRGQLIKKPEVKKLVKKLLTYDKPSYSLLIFLDYLVEGKVSIKEEKSFWQLCQFIANQQKNITSSLDLDTKTFKYFLVELNTDLLKYAEEKEIKLT
jgi:hypothetical protein